MQQALGVAAKTETGYNKLALCAKLEVHDQSWHPTPRRLADLVALS